MDNQRNTDPTSLSEYALRLNAWADGLETMYVTRVGVDQVRGIARDLTFLASREQATADAEATVRACRVSALTAQLGVSAERVEELLDVLDSVPELAVAASTYAQLDRHLESTGVAEAARGRMRAVFVKTVADTVGRRYRDLVNDLLTPDAGAES